MVTISGHSKDNRRDHGDDQWSKRKPTLAKQPVVLALGSTGKGAYLQAADNHVMETAHHAAHVGQSQPVCRDAVGLCTACWFYIWDPKHAAKSG